MRRKIYELRFRLLTSLIVLGMKIDRKLVALRREQAEERKRKQNDK